VSQVMSALITLFLLFADPTTVELPPPSLPGCDPIGEPRKYTEAEREETRARVQAVCRHVKASPITCAYMDASVVRESDGRAGVHHTKGEGENGLGPLGLSLTWHADKWPGEDEDPMFCVPEVSALVALEILHRAFARYDAQNFLDAQAIYAGSFVCWSEGDKRRCGPNPTRRTEAAICSRMRLRGFSCRSLASKKDLGRHVPKAQLRELAFELHESFEGSPSS